MKRYDDLEQGSDEWLAFRSGRPTASEFKKLITSTGEPSKSMKDYAIQLAAEKYAGKYLDRWQGNQYTEAGHEREELARNHYEFTTGETVEQTGFVTDDEITCGFSPDGIVNDDGLIEIKCLSAKEHVKAIQYCNKNGKPPTTYTQQVQGQMMIMDRKWCDMVFYHPDLPSCIIRCEPILEVVEGLKAQIKAVNAMRDAILSELKWT